MSSQQSARTALSVLLVEDNPGDVDLILAHAEEETSRPLELVVRGTLAGAIEAAAATTPDIILLDLGLPDSTGLRTLLHMRGAAPDIPVIVLTGQDDHDIAARCIGLGAQDYLVKGRFGGFITGPIYNTLDRLVAQRALDHLNKVLRAIRNVGKLVVHERDPRRLIEQTCKTLVETRGYQAAWIAIFDEDRRRVWAAEAGCGEAFSEMTARLEAGELPACGAAALGGPDVVAISRSRDICGGCPLKRRHEEHGSYAVRLEEGGRVHGLMSVHLPSRFVGDEEEISLFSEVADDVAFALQNIELSRQRDRFAKIVESSAEAMALIDRDYIYLEANPSYQNLLGDSDAVTGRRVEDVLGQDFFRETVEPQLERCLSGEEVRFETKLLAPDGGARFLDAIYTPCRSPHGAIDAVATCIRDITELRQMQASLAQSDRLASMGMLAAGVAHEINNPLAYILYNLESLTEDLPVLADAMRRCVEALRDATGDQRLEELEVEVLSPREIQDVIERAQDALTGTLRIKDIARGLGTFSKVERDEQGPVDLKFAIECAISMAFNEIKYRAKLVRDFGDVPRLMASEGRISQVFLNLLINAAHAIDEGDVAHNEIRIRTWAGDDDVFAEVRDTGNGILPGDLDRLFEPFFSTKGLGLGSGLGLAICHNIITGFGGDITVESEVGAGTGFTIRFPLGAEARSAPRGADGTAAPEAPADRGRVLVVDDEDALRAMMPRMLREHDVITVRSGEDARALLERDDAFDIILCDVMMPQISGMTLHEWLVDQNAGIAERVIFITGGVFTPRAREYMRKTNRPSVEKPFDVPALRRLVSEQIAARRRDQREGESP